ncbi:hypothetical protein DW020_08100 [Clostridium sp. AF37-5AT]|jgi:hypothetical protein|nr:hypothetical protein [Clostridium sp. AF37-5AT]RHO95548.1 hypothetical protein DW020_08100 [Clostridium sp. AF37-5AT]
MKGIFTIRDITNKKYRIEDPVMDFDKNNRKYYEARRDKWNQEHPLMPVTITWTLDTCVGRMREAIEDSLTKIIKYSRADLENPVTD